MNKLRIAVIGAGRLGGFHAQKLAARDDVELVAVVDPLPASRDRVAAECHTEALADYAGLLDRLDAAVIAAPTSLHHRIAREFLEAGVPSAGRKAALHHAGRRPTSWSPPRGGATSCSRWATSSASIRPSTPPPRNVRDPKYIEAVRASGFTFRSTDVGVVLDLMIHDIDLVLSLVGSPRAKGRGPGRLGPRRPRRRGQRPAGVRVRLRGHALGVARELRGGAADAGLVGRGFCRHRLRRPHRHDSSAPAKRCCGGSSTSMR